MVRLRSLVCALLILGGLTGCGDIAFQTRYIPRASQLTWNTETKQLPWQPPGEVREYEEHEFIPRFPPEIIYDIDYGVHDYHYAGDGCPADTGEREPLVFD